MEQNNDSEKLCIKKQHRSMEQTKQKLKLKEYEVNLVKYALLIACSNNDSTNKHLLKDLNKVKSKFEDFKNGLV
jgi:hypothetical protein